MQAVKVRQEGVVRIVTIIIVVVVTVITGMVTLVMPIIESVMIIDDSNYFI